MLLIAMDNELFYSPIGDNPERVIDIGTGTGVWAVYDHPASDHSVLTLTDS